MQSQPTALSPVERIDIAQYLTRRRADEAEKLALAPLCKGGGTAFDAGRPAIRVGWGHDTARYVTAEDAGFSAADIPGLQLKWAFAYPGAMRARSQPAIGHGAVYTGSQDGHAYAFHLKSGCERWSYDAGAEVRTGVVLVDSSWFYDGFGINGVQGDLIQLASQAVTARIVRVDYANNRLTVDRDLSWSAGQGVSQTYSGTSPDVGAFER